MPSFLAGPPASSPRRGPHPPSALSDSVGVATVLSGYHPAMKERLDRLGRRWSWLGLVLRVQGRYGELNGNYLAAAITLAGFLSLFPLLLVAFAVLGFLSAGHVNLGTE